MHSLWRALARRWPDLPRLPEEGGLTVILDPMALWGLAMPRHKADALIQAAPNLLAAMEEAIALLEQITPVELDLDDWRELVAKAKGA